ncbi:MAG: glycosyltransferase family 4 protein [Alphaproteobacteria bacterium]
MSQSSVDLRPASPIRPVLAMLAAHDPAADPRIRWEAESARPYFDVYVLGLDDGGTRPGGESLTPGIPVRRCAPEMQTTVATARSLIRLLWRRAYAPLRRGAGQARAPGRFLVALVMTGGVAAHLVLGLIRSAGAPATGRGGDAAGAGLRPHRLRRRLGRWLRAIGLFHWGLLLWQIRHVAGAALVLREAVDRLPRSLAFVHCNDLDTLLAGASVKDGSGARLVYDAHEFWPHSFPEVGASFRWFFTVYEAMLIGDADEVISVNPLMAGHLARVYGLDHVRSVPNAEPYIATRAARADEEMDSLAAGRVRFLFQGRLAAERGLDELVRAWDRDPPENAVLFLRGPDSSYKDRLRHESRGLACYDRSLFFLPGVAEDELIAAAAPADVGIIPYAPSSMNNRYACPNKLSQYLHAGLMVLSNDLAYVRQVLEADGTGMVTDFDDGPALSALLKKIAADPALRARCRANAARAAREHFNWQRVAPDLLAAYAIQV